MEQMLARRDRAPRYHTYLILAFLASLREILDLLRLEVKP